MSYQQQFDQIIKRYKKGVCKLTCSAIEVDINEPYSLEDESGAVGTGFFVDKKHLYLKNHTDFSSYIVTNAHVVECCPSKRVKVSFPYLGEVNLFAEIIIICREIDFAVLKMNSEMNMHLSGTLGKSFAEIMEMIPLCIPDEDVLNTTEHVSLSVLGIGYPLDSDDSQISLGSVSGKCEHMLQMNQSISSGNSGGPLFTPDGKLIGITAASFEDSEGISLCIPWSHISRMLQHYNYDDMILRPPSLGITTEKLVEAYALTKMKDSSIRGALVKKVFTGSCLYRKGLSIGDVITSIGDCNKEFTIDRSGLVQSPYQSDKIHFSSLNVLLDLDNSSMFLRTYTKKGKVKTINFVLAPPTGTLKNIMPVLEKQDCLLLGGVVFTDLTKNHIEDLEETALDPTIVSFLTSTSMSENAVVISGFKQPTTLIEQGYSVTKMSIVNSVQGKKVKTIEQLREILTELIQSYFDDIDNMKKRFVEIKTPMKTYLFDLKKAFDLEPYLLMAPGFPEEHSIISQLVQNDDKRQPPKKKRRKSSRLNK
tara:strand:- start:3332 stop:4939 length:1608 start_codon:yes stop_codon:yes gene_type:complete